MPFKKLTENIKKDMNRYFFTKEELSKIFVEEKKEPTQEEKDRWFLERTNKHIDLVRIAAEKIVDANPEFKEFDGTELLYNVSRHDSSKFEDPELEPYIELTWQHKQGRKYETPGTIGEKDINDATLHHIINNEHHPEFWNKEKANIDPKNRDKSVECLDATKMPPIAIAEMISDWQAMAEELSYGEKKSTARGWWDKQRDVRWHFSKKQEELIDKLLKVFEGE